MVDDCTVDDALARPDPLLRRERPRLRDLQREGPERASPSASSPTPCRTSASRDREAGRSFRPIANQDLSNEAFPYYTFREDVEIAGIPVFMTRLGYTAELGYELWVDARPGARALGRPPRRRRAARDEGDRHDRARPLPHRGRLHHRRHRVRPDRLPVRMRARLVGRPRQGRLPGKRGARARQGRDEASPDERRPRVRRRRGARRRRSSSTARRSASSRRRSSRPISTARRSASRRSARI